MVVVLSLEDLDFTFSCALSTGPVKVMTTLKWIRIAKICFKMVKFI